MSEHDEFYEEHYSDWTVHKRELRVILNRVER